MTVSDRRPVPPPVAVIGASGWIGRAVVQQLACRHRPVLAMSRRRPHDLPVAVEWSALDARTDVLPLARALRGAKAIINVAGAAHLDETSSRRADAAFANEVLPAIVAAAARRADVDRLVHLSSIKAVGEGGEEPLRAESDPRPTTPYGKSKLAGERAVLEATTGKSDQATIVRAPMVYGPGAPSNLARLARLAASVWPVPLPVPYPRRSLVFIGNLASLLTHLAEATHVAQIVHIADEPHLTTRELVSHLARAANRRDRVIPLPLMSLRLIARVMGRLDDVARLSSHLIVAPSPPSDTGGWQPPFPQHVGFYLGDDRLGEVR